MITIFHQSSAYFTLTRLADLSVSSGNLKDETPGASRTKSLPSTVVLMRVNLGSCLPVTNLFSSPYDTIHVLKCNKMAVYINSSFIYLGWNRLLFNSIIAPLPRISDKKMLQDIKPDINMKQDYREHSASYINLIIFIRLY